MAAKVATKDTRDTRPADLYDPHFPRPQRASGERPKFNDRRSEAYDPHFPPRTRL